jgi:lysophospholipase L1-like esterase
MDAFPLNAPSMSYEPLRLQTSSSVREQRGGLAARDPMSRALAMVLALAIAIAVLGLYAEPGVADDGFQLLGEGTPFVNPFSADASTFWSGEMPGAFEIHDTATAAERSISVLPTDGFVGFSGISLAPDGSHVAALAIYFHDGFDGCRLFFGSSQEAVLPMVFPEQDALPCNRPSTPSLAKVSADGTWLVAYDQDLGDGYYALNTRTGTVAALAPPPASARGSYGFSFSFPSNGATGVAISEDAATSDPGHAYLVHADGSPASELSLPDGYQFPYGSADFPWSPDGHRVAIPVSKSGAPNAAAIIDVTTGTVLSLLPDAEFGGVGTGAFSAGGSHFVYWACDRSTGSCDGYHEAIWEASVDGSSVLRVSPAGLERQPQAPIVRVGAAFAAEASLPAAGHVTIYSFGADGSGFRTVAEDGVDQTLGFGALHGSESRIVFGGWHSGDNSHGNATAWSVLPDGSGLKQLVPDDPNYSEVALDSVAPVGDRIAGLLRLRDGTSYQLFTAYHTSGPGSEVPTPPPPTVPSGSNSNAPTTFVALGDSYSSGEGASPFLQGTATRSNKCHRSVHAYAERLRGTPGFPATLRFVACSGATIANFYARKGQYNEKSGQLSALDGATALVSLTVGGNDVEFGPLIKSCVVATLCQLALNAPTRALIAHTTGRLDDLYRAVLSRASKAQVFILGYPHFFSSHPSLLCNGIDASEARWVTKMEDALNNGIKKAIRQVGSRRLHYVDTATAFQGGELCSSKTPVYMNGVIKAHKEYSFHPTALGQKRLASRLAHAVRGG